MIYKLQTKFYGRAYGYEIASPDFAQVARGFGALGLRVEEPGELEGALREALSAGRPAIVDVVTGDYPYPSFELKI